VLYILWKARPPTQACHPAWPEANAFYHSHAYELLLSPPAGLAMSASFIINEIWCCQDALEAYFYHSAVRRSVIGRSNAAAGNGRLFGGFTVERIQERFGALVEIADGGTFTQDSGRRPLQWMGVG